MSKEEALKKAKEWWSWISGDTSGITTEYMKYVDEYLKAADMTREDIGATDEAVEKSKIISYSREAKRHWDHACGEYGTPWSLEQMDKCLEAIGKTREDIHIDDHILQSVELAVRERLDGYLRSA